MDKRSAVGKVFGTVELLEAILVELPVKDLLLSRKTCQTWTTTVDSSIRLQQCLFYRPAGEPIVHEGESHLNSPVTSSGHAIQPLENPLFRRGEVRNRPDWQAFLYGTAYCYTLGVKQLDDLAIWDRRHASWKKMLLCQPPLRKMAIHYYLKNMVSGGRQGTTWVEAEGGVTAGKVFRVVKRLRKRFGPRVPTVFIRGKDEWRILESNEQVIEMAERGES